MGAIQILSQDSLLTLLSVAFEQAFISVSFDKCPTPERLLLRSCEYGIYVMPLSIQNWSQTVMRMRLQLERYAAGGQTSKQFM